MSEKEKRNFLSILIAVICFAIVYALVGHWGLIIPIVILVVFSIVYKRRISRGD